MGMTEDEIISYVKRKLGDGITDVELTDDHLSDVMRDTKRFFSTRVGFKTFRQVQLQRATSVYIMDPDVIEVLRIYLPSSNFPAVDTDDFSYTYSLLFGQWRSPGASPMPYSDLVQRLQYLKMSSNIFSADREFIYHPNTRELEIMPAPSILGIVLAEVWSSVVETRDLLPEDEDLFLRWALAEAKETLGRIRQKFSQYTTVGGDKGLNAEALLVAAEKEKALIRQQALLWKRAVPLVSG
jgi:hypothetical protein